MLSGDATMLIRCKLGVFLCGFGTAILGTVVGKSEKLCAVEAVVVAILDA
jgi:hypothetical protein